MSAAAPASLTAKGTAALTGTRGKGRAARRNVAKNASHVMDYLETLEDSKDKAALEAWMTRNAVQLARVTRQSGGGHLRVTLQDGSTDVDVSIAGAIRTKGSSRTKGDRPNVMNVNDLIVLHGPQAAGKIPREFYGRIEDAFARLRVSTPKGFFVKGATDAAGAGADDMGFDWDTDEAAVAEAFAAAAKTGTKTAKAGAGADSDSDSEDEIDLDAI